MQAPPHIQQRLDALPREPGCYLMKSHEGEVVYVGKATSLRNRVRSYFGATTDTRPFVQVLSEILGDIEVIVTNSAKEALILENRLIKKHRPRYNIQLKDDTGFLHLSINRNIAFPRIEVVRKPKKKRGVQTFGPYHSSGALRKTLHVLNRHFYLRTCPDTVFRNRARPCLENQIGRCPGPCVLPVPQEEYDGHLDDAVLFLEGKTDSLTKRIERKMLEAADRLEFERAALHRNQLEAIEASLATQDVDRSKVPEADLFGCFREGPHIAIQVHQIREGALIASRPYPLGELSLSSQEALEGFVQQYYQGKTVIPKEVLLPTEIQGMDTLASWLGELGGRKVKVAVPQRGFRKRLIENACRNARQTHETHQNAKEDSIRMLRRLQEGLGLANFPGRIECMDISNIQGTEAVASDVCFLDGAPAKSEYRHYRIQLPNEPNDFAMMMEVVFRRFRRGKEEGNLPDLLVVDGGKGQLNAALTALHELGIVGVDVVGLAKARVLQTQVTRPTEHSDERVFLPGRKNPIVLRQNSAELYLLTRIRDEAHRFAINYHRKLRGKRTLTSSLDQIPGVGPSRRKALLRAFGSLRKIREATPEELAKLPGVGMDLALLILQSLGGTESQKPTEE